MARRQLHPVFLVACLGLIALIAIALHLAGMSAHRAQQLTALVLLLFFGGAVLLSPVNGLMLLFLLPPLFNGEHQRPYFWLLEVLVYLTLAAGLAAHLRQHARLSFPYAPVFLLFLLSTIVSFPLNAKELWLALHVVSWREALDRLLHANLEDDFYYLRMVLDVASGIGLYVLVVNQEWRWEALRALWTAVAVLGTAVTAVGLALYCFPPGGQPTFLTLWLGGIRFSGLGFNVSYFGQYAVTCLPFAVMLVADDAADRWCRVAGAISVPLMVATILMTYQRGAFVVLLVELGLLLAAAASMRSRRALLGVGAALSVLVLLITLTPLGSVWINRATMLWKVGDPYRAEVLRVAWHMFLDQPLLGSGAGRYADVFQSYSSRAAPFRWGSLSSHNLYAQLLAEQGSLGLLSFLALLGVTLLPALRRQRQLGAARPVVLFLLVSLGGWLVYGLFQYTFLLRSMQVYFWISLGLLVHTAGAPAARPSGRARWLLLVVLLLVVAGTGSRIHAGLARDLPANFRWGLHAWKGPEGVQWTRGGAVMRVTVEGPVLGLTLGFPVVDLTGRAQTVHVSVDGAPVGVVTLDTPGWKTLDIPVRTPVGETMLLQLRVGYVFTPAALGITRDPARYGVLLWPLRWRADAGRR